MNGEPLLQVEDLTVVYETERGRALTVDGLTFDVREGETLGIVGESGSGKSMTSLAILGLLPRGADVTGSIRFRGRELLGMRDSGMRNLRGNQIAMIFQDALAALNPVMTVGAQLAEAIGVHHPGLRARDLRARALALLELVGIPSPERRIDQYPHEFSGGMRQRAVIAMSVANEPALLIADEPTTALDVTVQAQILQVLGDVQREFGTAIVMITHDLGVVAGIADRVLVMYAGDRVEEAPVDPIFYEPQHPYTQGLLDSRPRLDRRSRDHRLFQIQGQPPAATALPAGCRFGERCPHFVEDPCALRIPEARSLVSGHLVACHRVEEIAGPAHA